jgi:glycosyltransferase involved in cell wall biosynthesis
MMNPAGGINDFINSTVPFVQQAIIMDTGSNDGTLEALQKARDDHPNLLVLQRGFDDFSSSRNFVLQHVKTTYSLCLDADERLAKKDFIVLNKYIHDKPDKHGFVIKFYLVYADPKNDTKNSICGHNPRLFKLSKKTCYKNFYNQRSEQLFNGSYQMTSLFWQVELVKGASIKHFCIDKETIVQKERDWYEKVVDNGNAGNISPSQVENFKKWKTYNLRRAEF